MSDNRTKLEIKNTKRAIELLLAHGIVPTIEDELIHIRVSQYEQACKVLEKDELPPIHTVHQKSGPKTRESQGKRRRVRLSITISAEAADYLYSQSKEGELVSHTISRLMLEHRMVKRVYPKVLSDFTGKE